MTQRSFVIQNCNDTLVVSLTEIYLQVSVKKMIKRGLLEPYKSHRLPSEKSKSYHNTEALLNCETNAWILQNSLYLILRNASCPDILFKVILHYYLQDHHIFTLRLRNIAVYQESSTPDKDFTFTGSSQSETCTHREMNKLFFRITELFLVNSQKLRLALLRKYLPVYTFIRSV